MSLLFRYLTKNNAMILLPTLAVGIGLYVLTDLFERLDNFIEAGLSVGMVLTYFVVKMPLVISQILPLPGNASPPASGRKRSARRTSRQRC